MSPVSFPWGRLLGAACLSLALSLPAALHAQEAEDFTRNQETHRIRVLTLDGPIRLDGVPDEPFWATADSATAFWMKSPLVKPDASPTTAVRLATDGEYLYVAAWCRELEPVNVQTLRRDASYWRGDGIGIVLDPVNQRTFAYFFGVNPYGTQMDGLILGVNEEVGEEWDGRFFAETKQEPGLWTAEMAIPLRSLRFPADQQVWGVNFVRNVINRNEVHTWAPVPIQFGSAEINYTGQMLWDKSPAQSTSNVALIPYTLAGLQKEPTAAKPLQEKLAVGLDARIGLASSLNLDLTLNPDFSQAEIDEQPVNLTRFSIRLPERRTFFLENRDVFTNFGTSTIQPFFSRRIGLDDQGRSVPILFGARLSGNAAPDTRVGLLNMQTLAQDGTEAQNFSAIAVHQQVLSRSIIRALVTNRQAFGEGEFRRDDYGRTAGLEAVYQSPDGKFDAWGKYHHSFREGVTGKNGTYSAGVALRKRRFGLYSELSGAGENFYADMGFIQRIENFNAATGEIERLGFHHIYNELTWNTYPEQSRLFNRHWASLVNFTVWNPDGSLNETNHSLEYSWFFKDRRFLQVFSGISQVNLLFPAGFVRGGEPLPIGSYTYAQGGAFFDTDRRKTWYFSAGMEGGQFYNGHSFAARGGVSYRVQPYGSLSLNASWNRVALPQPYGSADILNLTTRLDITFTRALFWTTFFQYNTQVQVFNINSRFQWRFAPLSDLFLVYTDSYTTPDGIFRDRSRTIVLKLNYWWSL